MISPHIKLPLKCVDSCVRTEPINVMRMICENILLCLVCVCMCYMHAIVYGWLYVL